jgi:transcriptional regulator with XRE-family HTH domain
MTTKKAPRKTVLGTNLGRYINSKNISQSELARKSGISVSNINQYISGRSNLKVTTLLKICQTLDVTPNRLLGYQ